MSGLNSNARRSSRPHRRRKEISPHSSLIIETTNFLSRAFERLRNGWGMMIFTIFVCVYIVDFYYLSPQNVQGERVSVSDAVRLSKPDSSLLAKAPGSNTVITLPGAIKSDGKKFDPSPDTVVVRDPNTLPGAIGLIGSFDENSVNIVPKDGENEDHSSVSTAKKKSKHPSERNLAEKHAGKAGSNAADTSVVKSSPKSKETKSKRTENKGSSVSSKAAPIKRKKKRRKKKKSLKRKMKVSQTESTGSTSSDTSTSESKKADPPSRKVKDVPQTSSSQLAQGIVPVSYDGPHPMNRQMKELQVSGQTGVLDESAIREAYGKLVRAYLKPFAAKGIKRRSFFEVLRRKTYSLTPPGANKGVQTILFQIVSNKLYLLDPYEVSKNAKPFYRSRIKELVWLLSDIARRDNVPDTEFLLAIHDCVQTVSAEHAYRGAIYRESHPTFTIVSCNFSDNIPFPMWEGDEVRGGLKSWDEKMAKYKTLDDTAWEQKKTQAVFRGGNRPSMYFKQKKDADEHCDKVGRSRLHYLGKEHPDLFDVGISGTCGGMSHVLSHLSEAGHHSYKYIVYAEGNCFWADRLNKQVFGPSAVIKQETPCGQFWEPLLKPMVHYIPTDFFFSNTVDQIKWAQQNDDKVKEIVKNANEFAANFLSVKSIKLYVEVLLVEYSKLLTTKTIKAEKGSQDVTVES